MRARQCPVADVRTTEKEAVSTKSRTRSKTRLSRALGIALTPKAAKYLEKRPYAPGEHGRTKRKHRQRLRRPSAREAASARPVRHPREAAEDRTFEEARKTAGLTGENLVEHLEMRLDALVLRSGFARTTAQARQMVVHRHILVDGQLVDRPSFRVKPGQLIQVKPNAARRMEPFQVAAAGAHRRRAAEGPGLPRGRARQAAVPARAPPEARRGPRDVRGPARRRVLRAR